MFRKTVLSLTVGCAVLSANEVSTKETTTTKPALKRGERLLKDNHFQFFSGMMGLSMDLMYENVIQQKHGFALGAGGMYYDDRFNFNSRLYYRNYVKKENLIRSKTNSIVGTVLKGFGPSVGYVHTESFARDKDGNDHNYDADFLTLGIHYNKKRVWKNGFVLDTRIGYGFPFEVSEFNWHTTKPSEGAGLTTDIVRGSSGLDLGITVGVIF